jgi:hypothetical protein
MLDLTHPRTTEAFGRSAAPAGYLGVGVAALVAIVAMRNDAAEVNLRSGPGRPSWWSPRWLMLLFAARAAGRLAQRVTGGAHHLDRHGGGDRGDRRRAGTFPAWLKLEQGRLRADHGRGRRGVANRRGCGRCSRAPGGGVRASIR